MDKCGRPGAEAVMHVAHSPVVKDQVKDSACISEYIIIIHVHVHVCDRVVIPCCSGSTLEHLKFKV